MARSFCLPVSSGKQNGFFTFTRHKHREKRRCLNICVQLTRSLPI